MGFLGDLAGQISSQFNLGENTTTSLDAVVDGQQVKYGSLGDFASQFDQSAERRYVEEGYLRRDPYNTDPKQFETLWQEPNATVLVKKRMFSSIAENFRPDFMDADEKVYYKAMRVLFQNKCSQIAALEKLGKIQQVTAAVGSVADQLVPVIITLADLANNGFANGSNAFGLFPGGTNPYTTQDATSFFKTVDRLRVLYAYNQAAQYTTWLTDPTNLYESTFGAGSGVIEITNFTNINTSTTLDFRSPGQFSFTIADPYEAMLITDYDIEVAISDATNLFYNKKSFQFGQTSINQVISDQQTQLNSIRNARNASPLTFKIDPSTLLGKRVTVIIDRLGVEIPFTYDATGGTGFPGLGAFGNSVSVPDDFLRGGNIAGYDGLDSGNAPPMGPDNNIRRLVSTSELSIFKTIITSIFQQLQLLGNSQNAVSVNNNNFNYARRKLRFNFSGKLIIQPMDIVSIYMNSKSQYDNKILAGLQQMFSGFGILQSFTNTLTSLTNSYDTLFNPSGNISVQAEKSIYVGPDFPNYLWATMRSQFVSEKEGTHVFAGVVTSAQDNWSDGKFSIDVSGTDNTFYFDQGKINFKPGVDSFNGLIFDPLTPFKSNFDSTTTNPSPISSELLNENKYLLSETGSSSKNSIVRYKLGSLAGEKATQANFIQDQSIDPITQRLTRVFYAPDGLVYKWKQGIGVFTQAGSTADIHNPNLVGTPNIFNNAFAQLDIMNVLSLLITGTPYNFATYYKATANLSGIQGDPQSKKSASYSFANSLKNDLAKSNTLWGNFIPFKSLTMNESAIAQSMQLQSTITNINSDLDARLKTLANYQTSITQLGAVNVLSKQINSTADASISSRIIELQSKISNLTSYIQDSISDIQSATKQFYNQVDRSSAYDSNYLINGKNNPSDSAARKLIRKQTNSLTRRMSYDVRANMDKNLFIVDDYYDIDYDIAAFNKSLNDGLKLYSTEYTSVREKIVNVADLLNLEVFCDSQGHIRVRPPQYNRMPSSIFNRMIYLKKSLGIQVYPKFLESLFTDQLTSLRQNIEIIEDQIRLDCAILGKYNVAGSTSPSLAGDVSAQSFIYNVGAGAGQASNFSFISDSSDTITNIDNLIKQANQETAPADYSFITAAATSNRSLFSNGEQYSVLLDALQAQNQSIQDGTNVSSAPTTSIFQSSVVQRLITRISTKSGQSITSADYLTSAGPDQPLEVDSGQTIDLFKVTNDLTMHLQSWQTAVKAFYHTIKNAAEYQSLDDDATTSNSLQNPGLFNNSYIPEVFEHMIEDETYDDYGLNSGTRYVIKNRQIRSLRIAENAPAFTSVEVQGTLPFFEENTGPVGLQSFPGGGNAIVSAIAIDYDMWRNYGFKQGSPIKIPFLSDPLTQSGPYASMILTRNRHNILRGTCTIAGNEFMQAGEVVYLEDRNLLFYINGVKHSFAEGGSFNTTLDLCYGHAIGEYIPSVMDTVGKLIYKNQEASNTIIQRQDSSSPEQNVGVIQLDGKNTDGPILSTGSEDEFPNSYSASNQTVVNNIMYNTAYKINQNGAAGNNTQATVELRIYHDSSHGVDDKLMKAANGVLEDLTGVSQGPQTSPIANQPIPNPPLPKGSVNITTIDLDDNTDRRSPSRQAIDAARNQIANSSFNTGSPSSSNPIGNDDNTSAATINSNNIALRTALFSYIIDCWVTLTTVTPPS